MNIFRLVKRGSHGDQNISGNFMNNGKHGNTSNNSNHRNIGKFGKETMETSVTKLAINVGSS
jgi:hypothetical protein